MKDENYRVEIIFNDNSKFNFEVKLQGTESDNRAFLMMIAIGTLQATTGVRVLAFTEQGDNVLNYVR